MEEVIDKSTLEARIDKQQEEVLAFYDEYVRSSMCKRFRRCFVRWMTHLQHIETADDMLNHPRRKQFLKLCKSLYRKYPVKGMQTALRDIIKANYEYGESNLLTIKFLFLLTNINRYDVEIERKFVAILINEIVVAATKTCLRNRLMLIQKGVIEMAFLAAIESNDVDICYSVKSLYDFYMQNTQTKNRIKEMSIIPALLEALSGIDGRVIAEWDKYMHHETAQNMLKVTTMREENRAVEDPRSLRCSGCFKFEEDVLFQKCSRCKLAFFCSKKCLRKNWKKHKQYCKLPGGRILGPYVEQEI